MGAQNDLYRHTKVTELVALALSYGGKILVKTSEFGHACASGFKVGHSRRTRIPMMLSPVSLSSLGLALVREWHRALLLRLIRLDGMKV